MCIELRKLICGDIPILPLTNTVDIYWYCDEILKHTPKDVLKTIQNDLLYTKKKVVNPDDNDRRTHYTNASNPTNRTDEDLTDRIAKFQDQLKSEYLYSIPLRFLCDLQSFTKYFRLTLVGM